MRKGAVIVETRPIPNLKEIIEGHLKYLPDDWGLTVYLSEENKIANFSRPARCHIIRPINVMGYNSLFKDELFWEGLPYDKVLVFQSDSMLLREGIEDFLEWDYVGAPWKFQEHGGNGGLSLRDVDLMAYLCKHYSFTARNEDVLFCNLMEKHGLGKMAPRDICSQFSTEAIYSEGTIGYHGIDKWLTPEECNNIRTQYDRDTVTKEDIKEWIKYVTK